jgi:hypothetical protein
MCLLIRAIFICCFPPSVFQPRALDPDYYRRIHSDAASVPTRYELVASVRWPPTCVMGVDLTPYVDAWAAAGRDFCGLVGLLLVGRLFGHLIPSDPIT